MFSDGKHRGRVMIEKDSADFKPTLAISVKDADDINITYGLVMNVPRPILEVMPLEPPSSIHWLTTVAFIPATSVSFNAAEVPEETGQEMSDAIQPLVVSTLVFSQEATQFVFRSPVPLEHVWNIEVS